MEVTNEERRGTSCFEFQLQRRIESKVPFNVSEVLWGSDTETKPHIKVSVAEVGRSQKIDSSLSTTSKWGDEIATLQIDEYTPAIPLFFSALRYLQDLHRGVAGVKGSGEDHY